MNPVWSLFGHTRPRRGWRYAGVSKSEKRPFRWDHSKLWRKHHEVQWYRHHSVLGFCYKLYGANFEKFFSDVTKDNERVESSDDLNIGQETSSVIMTTVRFNNTVMINENVVLNSLIFRIYSYQDFPLKGIILTYDRQYRIHKHCVHSCER